MPKPERIRVLTMIDFLVAGGAEALAVEIAARIDPERFESTLCATRFWTDTTPREQLEPALERLSQAGVRLVPLARSSPRKPWEWRPLLAFLHRHPQDVLHTHKFGSNVWGSVLGPLTGIPVIVAHEHTWSFQGQPLRVALDRHLVARAADAFVSGSDQDRRQMIEVERVPPETAVMIRGGILTDGRPTGRDVRAELGIPPDAPVVVAVGMLRAQKAFDVLIRAAGLLRNRFPAVRLLIAGGPNEMEKTDVPGALTALTAELGLADTVLMLGRRADVPDLVAAADVAALSSDYEGTSLTVMEYMRAGTPFVSTRVGGIPEIVEDRVHGRLVPPQDPAALAAAIGELLEDPEAARAMASRAQARALRDFSIEATIAQLEDLYVRLLDEKPARRRRAPAAQGTAQNTS